MSTEVDSLSQNAWKHIVASRQCHLKFEDHYNMIPHQFHYDSSSVYKYNKNLLFPSLLLSIVVDNDDNVNEHLSKLLNQLTAAQHRKGERERLRKKKIMREMRSQIIVEDALNIGFVAIISTYTCCCVSFFSSKIT